MARWPSQCALEGPVMPVGRANEFQVDISYFYIGKFLLRNHCSGAFCYICMITQTDNHDE